MLIVGFAGSGRRRATAATVGRLGGVRRRWPAIATAVRGHGCVGWGYLATTTAIGGHRRLRSLSTMIVILGRLGCARRAAAMIAAVGRLRGFRRGRARSTLVILGGRRAQARRWHG